MATTSWSVVDDAKGKYFNEKAFKPTMFLPTINQQSTTWMVPCFSKPGTIKETRQFIDQYSGVDGTMVYGMERFIYQYLSKDYDDEIEYDIDKIKLWSLDIETKLENGFETRSC